MSVVPERRTMLRLKKKEDVVVRSGVEGCAPARPQQVPVPRVASIEEVEILSCIGETFFAEVFKARVKATGHIVAVKRLDKLKLAQQNDKVRNATSKAWDLEAALHATLQHPLIVKLHSTFSTNEYKYFILDFCEYGDLAQYIGSALGSMSEADISYYVKQAAHSLAYLHKLSPPVIHRDIKLENCLIDANRNLLLSDFGSAGLIVKDLRRGTLCGTLDYLTPEFVSGKGITDKADVWALGVMAFELLTGKAPFAGYEGQKETCEAIKEGEVNIPQTFSEECRSFLEMTLERDEATRMTMEQCCTHPFLSKYHPNFEGAPPRPPQMP